MTDDTRDVALVSTAARMLAEAETMDDIREVMSMAQAASMYARKARLGLAAQNSAAAIRTEAEAKAGETLARMRETGERDSGGRGPVVASQRGTQLPDLGITRNESSRWQAVASVAPGVRATYVAEATAKGEEVTRTGLLRYAQGADQSSNLVKSATRVAVPEGQYRVLLADPPWQYDFVATANRAIENQYGTLTTDDIANYRDESGRYISDLAADDSVLFLWATAPKLLDAIAVLEAWGFSYVTNLVWVKDRIGMGYWARSQHELVLIGRRGQVSPPPVELRRSSVFDGRRGEHSVKPDLHEWIEEAFPDGGYVEVFCRRGRDGWAALGNEVAA